MGNSNIGRRFWRSSTVASLSQKNGFLFVNQIWHFKALNHYSQAHKIRFRLSTDFKTNLQETQVQRESFWRVLIFLSFSQKNDFVFVSEIFHFKAMYQYSLTQKVRYRLLIFTFAYESYCQCLKPCTNIHLLKRFDIGC